VEAVGVTLLGIIRPDEWEAPLFVHVLGALTLIGALALTSALLFSAWRAGSAASVRLAVRSLMLGVIPAWVVLRGSAEWIADKEGYRDLDDPPNWIDIGYMVSDAGFLPILISALLGWIALRKTRAGDGPAKTVPIAAILIALALVLNLVALWAMTTKPT
jgi:hypothetical protein